MATTVPRGDNMAVNELVAKYIGVVYRIVADLGIRRHDHVHDDAVQSGLERLVQAAQRYDSTKGVPFTSFAWVAVSSGVKDFLGGQQLVYEPLKNINFRARKAADFRRMSHAERAAQFGVDEQGNPIEPEQIYRGSQVPLETFCEMPVTPRELTSSIEDQIIASLDQTPSEAEALRDDLDRVMADLPSPLHETLVLRLQGHSNYEIASMLGCARSTVQQRLKRAVMALREAYGFEADIELEDDAA